MSDCDCSNSEGCECDAPPKINTSLEVATRGVSERIGARVSTGAAKALIRYCSTHGCSQSDALRVALAKLAEDAPPSPIEMVADILGCEATASACIAALRELDPSAEPEEPEVPPAPKKPANAPPTGNPLGGNAEPPPRKQLSAAVLAACARLGITPAEYERRKRSAVRTAGAASPAPAPAPRAPGSLTASEIAGAKKLGITPQEFVARKAAAVRTTPNRKPNR
jgi:hypothetical protein